MVLANALDTRALAQFRTGDLEVAVETQSQAFMLMPEGGDPSFVTRLELYEAALEGR